MASKYEDWGGRKWRKDNILELKVPEKKTENADNTPDLAWLVFPFTG